MPTYSATARRGCVVRRRIHRTRSPVPVRPRRRPTLGVVNLEAPAEARLIHVRVELTRELKALSLDVEQEGRRRATAPLAASSHVGAADEVLGGGGVRAG
jgi:hypothetical protein